MASNADAKKKSGLAAVVAYFREAREELQKVVWPTRKELYRHTWIVIAISLGVAALLGLLDLVLQQGLQFVL
ncbi:MAG: preprotein translocase subunit SecE [Candidatus Doudnabacteria bacterium]|nr:preprotein translocase subunit SecE [Candidatus Doudnabacteria bacterium]